MLKKGKHERHASYRELIAQIESAWAQIDPRRFAAPSEEPAPDTTLLSEGAAGKAPRLRGARPATAAGAAAPRTPSPAKSRLPVYAGLAAAANGVAMYGKGAGKPRCLRGSSFVDTESENVRISIRTINPSNFRGGNRGFRVVLAPAP